MTYAKSGATIIKQFIPRSIREKKPVRCSNDIKEDNRIATVMQRTLVLHEKYKSEQATDIQEVSKLEIDIMKERLSTLFLNTAFKYAKVIHIMEKKTRRTINTPLEAPDSAHRTVVLVISMLTKEEKKYVSTSQTTLLAATSWHKHSRAIRPRRGPLHKNNCENPQTNPACVHPPPN